MLFVLITLYFELVLSVEKQCFGFFVLGKLKKLKKKKTLLNFNKNFELDILPEASQESCIIEHFGCLFL